MSASQPAALDAKLVHCCHCLLTGRGRKAAAAAADDAAEWDWPHSRQQVLLSVHDVMRLDVRALFKGLSPAASMVNICMELVRAGCCSAVASGIVDKDAAAVVWHAV